MYNSDFGFIEGADCANFVSQCIWAGFGGDISRISGTAYPYDFEGSPVNCTTWNTTSNTSVSGYGSYSWKSAIGLAAYAEYSNNSSTQTGWRSTFGNAWNLSSQTNSFPSGNNYVASAMFVRGSSDDFGHVIFITKATTNSPDNMYYCAHTSAANNLCLGENTTYMTHPIKYAIPTSYKIATTCTGSYTSHSYPSVSSGYSATCSRCGYVNMYMRLSWNRFPHDSTVSISASELRNNPFHTISASVFNSSNVIVATGSATDSSSLLFFTNNMADSGLYKVVITVTDHAGANSVSRNYSYYIKVV